MWSYGGWGPGGSRYFFSFFADLESRLAKLLFVKRPFCICSVIFSRLASLSPNSSALRSWLSGLHLHLLFAAPAPGCSWTPGRNRQKWLQFGSWRVPQGCSSRAWLQGWGDLGCRASGVLDCFGKAHYLFPLSALLAGFFFFFNWSIVDLQTMLW